MTFRNALTYVAQSNDPTEIEKELQSQVVAHKARALKLEKPENDEDIYITTRIAPVINRSDDNHFKCAVIYYNLSAYKNKTTEELQEDLAKAKDSLEELREEWEEIEDLSEDCYADYDFDSEEQYKERLEELDDEIYLLESDIEILKKIKNSKSA